MKEAGVTYLSEEQAAQIKAILGGEPVALIAIAADGTTADYSMGPKGSEGDPVALHDFNYIDLGCLQLRSNPQAQRCCLYRCDVNGCRCIWYC